MFNFNHNKMNTFQQLHSYELGIVSFAKQYKKSTLFVQRTLYCFKQIFVVILKVHRRTVSDSLRFREQNQEKCLLYLFLTPLYCPGNCYFCPLQ